MLLEAWSTLLLIVLVVLFAVAPFSLVVVAADALLRDGIGAYEA